MGLSLARALVSAGARVTVVLGPVSLPAPRGAEVVAVTTARQMSNAVRRRLKSADAFVATAAVCDWRPRTVRAAKMKKGASHGLNLRLVPNPDILADAGKWKGRRPKPILVGFALETGNIESESRRKLKSKNLDLIIGNSPESFSSRTIRPFWLERDGTALRLPRQSKKALSFRIGRWLAGKLRMTRPSTR